MIFLSVGSELPFSRLVKTADKWSKDNPEMNLVAQVGKLSVNDYVPVYSEFYDFIEPEKYAHLAEKSMVMVTHAGMGSIISAMTIGKPLVIMPRLADLKEATTDHQCATAKKFLDKDGIFVTWDESTFESVLNEALKYSQQRKLKPVERFAQSNLLEKIRDFVQS